MEAKLPYIRYDSEPQGFSTLAQTFDWSRNHMKLDDTIIQGTGEGGVCFILDTGPPNHKALPKAIETFDFVNEPGPDGNGHHTHCKGIICEKNDEQGQAGYSPDVAVVDMKVLSRSGSGSTSGITRAILKAVELWNEWKDKKFIFATMSMSLGGPFDQQQDDALRTANNAGILVFAAAGNSGNSGVDHPGASKFIAACIAAFNSSLKISSFSSRGPEVDYAFPGENIVSTYLNDLYRTMSGTSMATPAACGAANAMLSTMPERAQEFRDVRVFQTYWDSQCTRIDQSASSDGRGVPAPTKLMDLRPWQLI